MTYAKESKPSKSWPVAYRWLAVGTVVVYTAIGSSVVNVAAAQELPSKQNSGAVPSSVLQFNIPPGTLGSVLPEF